MEPDKLGEMEGTLALPTRDRVFSAYFQLVWNWGSKEAPGRKQLSLLIHSWSKFTSQVREDVGEKKIIQDCREQKSSPTLLLAIELTRQHRKKLFFKAAFKSNAILWLPLTNHSKLSKLVSFLKHSLPTWECCGRKFE